MNRIVIAGCFALAFVFFFMNWFFVNIAGEYGVISNWASGLGMLKGNEYYPGSPFALIPLLASLVGTGLYFVKDQRGLLGSAIAGVAGAVSMVWVRIASSMMISSLKKAKPVNPADLNSAIVLELAKNITIHFTFIFYATIVLFAVTAAISFIGYKSGATTASRSGSIPPPSTGSFCTKCGAANPKGTVFCTTCGEKLIT